MIDYDKLQIAHELALNTKNYCIEIILGIQSGPDFFLRYTDDNGDNSSVVFCKSLDNLIAKLAELTHPKPKYAIGQEVWFYTTKKGICNLIITEIDSNDVEKYLCNYVWYKEDELYPTKTQLIEAQLSYWANLYQEANPHSICREPFENDIKTPYAVWNTVDGKNTIIATCLDCKKDWFYTYAQWDLYPKCPGCRRQLRETTEPPPFQGDIKGFNHSEDNLEKVECSHDGWEYCRFCGEDFRGLKKEEGEIKGFESLSAEDRALLLKVPYEETAEQEARGCSESIRKHHELEEECQHESYMTMPTLGDGKSVSKCKKCGKFYNGCQHESDGTTYDTIPQMPPAGLSNEIKLQVRCQYKCKKCGEFYK